MRPVISRLAFIAALRSIDRATVSETTEHRSPNITTMEVVPHTGQSVREGPSPGSKGGRPHSLCSAVGDGPL